jgi:protein SCO1/2
VRIVALLIVLLFAAPAEAALTQAQLSQASVTLPKGARLDPKLFGGRPAFVTFVDYTCNTLCGTDLALLSAAIQRAHLKSGTYRLVVLGLDPKDTASDARAMASKEIPSDIRANTTLLSPDQRTLDRETRALGFHYVYDRATDQFAHPAAVYVVAPDGTVRSVLSPFALDLTDLDALLTAPAPLSLYDRIHLLCYSYDPATGIYSPRIDLLLKLAALLTVLAMAAALAFFIRKEWRTA